MSTSRTLLSFQEWYATYQRTEYQRIRRLWIGSSAGLSLLMSGAVWWGIQHNVSPVITPSPAPPVAMNVEMTSAPTPAPAPTQEAPVGPAQHVAPPKPAPTTPPKISASPTPAPHPPVHVPRKKTIILHKKVHHTPRHPSTHPDPAPTHQAQKTTAPPPSDTPPASHASPPSTSPSNSASLSPATWQGDILAKIERMKRYPAAAQKEHHEGVALLSFTIDRQGQVLRAHIQKSSGSTLLDDETLALAHRASPFPPPPESIHGKTISMTVPISFAMERH